MLKEMLTQLRGSEDMLLATMATTGHIDINSTDERKAEVLAEMHKDLEAAGIVKPADPAPAPAAVDGMQPPAEEKA